MPPAEPSGRFALVGTISVVPATILPSSLWATVTVFFVAWSYLVVRSST